MILTERKHSKSAVNLSQEICQPAFPDILRRFLYDACNPNGLLRGCDIELDDCPQLPSPIHVHYSAAATFYAPSDQSGVGGMRREYIRANPKWFGKTARFDCAFIQLNRTGAVSSSWPDVARILLLFTFTFENVRYRCALVRWFHYISQDVDIDTGMRIVRSTGDEPSGLSIVPMKAIVRAAHLAGVCGTDPIPAGINSSNALDAFRLFYVNKYIDHQAFDVMHEDLN